MGKRLRHGGNGRRATRRQIAAMAILLDFDCTRHTKPLTGCTGQPVLYSATFHIGTKRGQDDFRTTLAEFKETVPACLRSWDDDDRLWDVEVTDDVRGALCEIFTNAERLFDDADNQLELFTWS